MTRLRCPAAFLLLLSFTVSKALSSEPFTYNINTKKWSHVLDDHFISVTINPTDLLQGKAFGLGMNSTVAILKGLSPAYIRIGSADTGKYTFKRSRYPSDVARTEDEFIITEFHWTTLNDVLRSAGLDVIVCLNAAHRNGASNKWDTRNSLELISFSDSQGYNLTFQLGYEVQRSSGLSGHQYGKDLKRLRTILNAFPRYQNSKLIGPDIRYLHKKDDVEFVNDVLLEAGPVLDAVTWHPRWPQPSKMKVSDISELGYEFPSDYIEWDRSQLGRILQRSIFKNPIWIGEPKTESTGTFAEGLLWARRLVLAAKLGVEVVMKQPSLMDISHPKPEYWIAFLHKRLLGKAVLETRAVNNQTEIAVVTHCTNPLFWSERSNKAVDGAVTVYAVNMGGKEQRVYIKGAWGGKSQIMLQYLLTSGSDPDSVFSQMTYLNGEPLMMTDDGHLPDITPRVRRIDRGVVFKLPPYSVGFWVIPDARVKICQVQPAPTATPNFDNLSAGLRSGQKNLPNIRNLNQLIVDKLKNPISESDEEFYDDRTLSDFSSERDLVRESIEAPAPRASRRVRQITVEDIGQELKDKIREIRDMLEANRDTDKNIDPSETLRAAEEKITSLTQELGKATRLSNQQEEFGRFLHHSGLNQDFGSLMVNGRTGGIGGIRRSVSNKLNPLIKAPTTFDPFEAKVRRFRRSLSSPEDDYEEESIESYSSEEEAFTEAGPNWKINYRKRVPGLHETSDESSDNTGHSGPPVLKGFEDKYRTFLSHRIQDGKRKLSDLRRQKSKKNETEEPRRNGASTGKKANILGNDLQEEILMKEVEVLQKTEEAMTNLIKNHKKRQQTIQEIILHEISDIKEDRLSALEDIRQQKELNREEEREDEEEIPKKLRNVAEVLHLTPKTKRSIGEGESSVNALPEEEKKSKIVKRSVDSSYERNVRRRKSRKSSRDEDDSSSERGSRRRRKSRSERLERMKNFIQSRERIRDRNIYRRKQNRNLRKNKLNASEESNEVLSNFGNDYLGKSEDLVIKEIQKEILKKPERSEGKSVEAEVTKKEKKVEERGEEKAAPIKKEEKTPASTNNTNNNKSSNDNDNNSGDTNNKNNGANENRTNGSQSNNDVQKMRTRAEEKGHEESTITTPRIMVKKVKAEEQAEYVPLKIDKNRGLNVLKRISNLVESINTREKSKAKKPSMDVEDLSEEFYGDSISKMSKRRHRRSHHHDGEVEEVKTNEQMEESIESPVKDLKELKALRKEIKLRKLLERRMRKKKLKEEEPDADSEGKASKSRLKGRVEEKHPQQIPSEALSNTMEEDQVVGEEGPQQRDPETGMEQAITETPPGQEKIEMDQEQQAVESPQMMMNSEMGTKQDEAGEGPRDTSPESEVEQVVEKASPQQEDTHAKEQDEEEVANAKEAGTDTVQAVAEESTQKEEDIEKVGDTVTEVHDEKVDEAGEEMILPEKAESADDTGVQTGQGNDTIEKTEKADEASKSENVEITSSTEAPITERTTVTSGKRKTSSNVEKTRKQLEVVEPQEDLNTVLVVPEIEGLVFNPLAVANPAEETDFQQEDVREDSPAKEDRFVVLDQFLQEEPPRDELYDRVESSGNENEDDAGGPADLISELMEGDKLKPWKGALMDTVHELRSKVKDITSNYKRSSFADSDSEQFAGEDEGSSQQDDTHSSFDHPLARFSSSVDSYISKMPEGTRDESSEVGDPAVTEAVPTETTYTSIPQKRTAKSRALRRARRGIFDRRPLTPEERIRSFKRAVHRRHSPSVYKNEVPIINEGENFWKMAGSTVKAVFNDVIPDAYGKTKNKIENLGIAEYFKEFGKIVEQMKNLDKLFANIGQTAVRNYIKGTEDDKGEYIQVIEKRRRSRRDVEDVKEHVSPNSAVRDVKEEEEEEKEDDGVGEAIDVDQGGYTTPMSEVTTERITEKEMTTTARGPQTGSNIRAKGLRNYVKERPNDLIRDIFLMDSNPGIVEVTKSPPTTEPPQIISLQPFESRYAKIPRMNNIHNRFFKRDRAMTEIQGPEMNKFAPWMKTTKEFINQALTTLQRQRELSEMIARESVNDLVKREIQRKVVGKRETGEDRHVFPVYQMPPNRKREIYGHPEDSLARYPSHLQPGVYIVPTEEMQNLRSEQVMKEAPSTRPGMPNVVTLNIYYDKKKQQDWESSKEEVIDTEKLDADFMRYYQEPNYSWNPVPAVNNGAEYLPPVQEPAIDARYIPQGIPPFPVEPKLHDPRLLPYGEPYHEWIPRGYPSALPRSQPPYVYPGDSHYSHPKTDWQELKHSVAEVGSLGNGVGDSGWAVQFQPTKKKAGRSRESLRAIDRQQRLLPDKKRSVGSKTDAGFPGLALPFWKFATPKKQPEAIEKTANLESSESLEELFAENRRRARLNESKQKEQKPEESEKNHAEEGDENEEDAGKAEAETSGRRKRRDVTQPTVVDFHDSDLIPEWFGTIQDLDNDLREYRNELERMTRVVALPWFDYEEDDQFFPTENVEYHRMRRSSDDKTTEEETKKAVKKLTDPDSSLEVLDFKNEKNWTNPSETMKTKEENGDALSQFFKYAYNSLVQMMKEMTGFI